MNVYLYRFNFDNYHRFKGTCLITVGDVTYTERIGFSVDITGYSSIDGVSSGCKLRWCKFDPYGAFDNPSAALIDINKALKKAVPRLTPAGKDAVYLTQGATDSELACIRAKFKDERVPVVLSAI